MVSLPTSGPEWCTAGASTRLASYSAWLVKTIEYLDNDYTGSDTAATLDIDHADGSQPSREKDLEAEDNSCSSSPCGENASCWNGNGPSFLCTCDNGFPHGNPYKKCAKCLYDSHCSGDGTCVNEECIGSSSQGPEGFIQVKHLPDLKTSQIETHSILIISYICLGNISLLENIFLSYLKSENLIK